MPSSVFAFVNFWCSVTMVYGIDIGLIYGALLWTMMIVSLYVIICSPQLLRLIDFFVCKLILRLLLCVNALTLKYQLLYAAVSYSFILLISTKLLLVSIILL